jgi:hypothetical protein
MKRHHTIQQQMEPVTQLSLFESQDTVTASSEAFLEAFQQLESESSANGEAKEAYECRRMTEMAEKLGWPPLSLGAVGRWPGVKIGEGETVWRTFQEEASDGTIGLVMLALHRQLNPLIHGCIDEKTGLHHHPVEVINQVEERLRKRMIQLAEALSWPRVSYWAASKVEVIGPGEEVWRKYFVYGCSGRVADAVGALERRLRGEPDKLTSRSQPYEDEED